MKNVSRIAGFLAVTATSAAAQVGEIPERYGSPYHGHEMMWGDSQWGGFGMFLGPIFMILLVVGIVASIQSAWRWRLSSRACLSCRDPGENGSAKVSHGSGVIISLRAT